MKSVLFLGFVIRLVGVLYYLCYKQISVRNLSVIKGDSVFPKGVSVLTIRLLDRVKSVSVLWIKGDSWRWFFS